jgi:DNA-binding SARP family transcriptional activator
MRPPLADPAAPPVDSSTVVNLFRGPFVTVAGRRHEVPEGSKRLLTFVALRRGRVERPHAAGALWPEGGDGRAAGNLRSSLWRLRGAGIDVLNADKWSLALRDDVVVDVHVVNEWANRVIAGRPLTGDLALSWLAPEHLDLLPGWYDDWAIADRERLRQRMLHAIEALSRELTAVGRYADAIEAAMVAADADPLRESAHRVLVEAHLAEGNWAEARHTVLSFRTIMHRELGVEPSPVLTALLHRPRRAVVGVRT